MESSFYRSTWLEEINKTIALITSSSEYQRYIKRKRAKAWNRLMFDEKAGARRHFALKWKEDKYCLECDTFLDARRHLLKFCRQCMRIAVINEYRSGVSIEAIASKYAVHAVTVVSYLKDKSRSLETAKASSK